MKELVLKLSQTESIQILPEMGLDFEDVDHCCGEIIAIFVNDDNGLVIGEDTASDLFAACIIRLQKALNNELGLHPSIKQNLGFMENQYCHQIPHVSSDFVKILSRTGESLYWVGSDYHVWSAYTTTKPMVATWLYNDEQGNIIFEVTPLYRWSFFPDEPEDPDFVTYEEFMQNYKPLWNRVIPRDIAIIWLEQMIKTFRSICKSEELYEDKRQFFGWKNE